MDKVCPICFKPFKGPPSGPVCCSAACGGKRSGLARSGKPKRWKPASKAALRERGQTLNLKLGTPAAQRSLLAGPFESNQEAKVWHLRNTRTQAEYAVTNLRKFCRDHPELFAPSPWELAYRGLLAVQASLNGTRTARPVSRYKDWTLTRPAHAP